MSEYQLEIKQVVDYPRCRIYRKFVQTLISDRSIRLGGSSGLFYYTVLCSYANFRTSYKRIDDISYTIYPGEWLCRVNELVEWFRTRFQHQTLSILQVLQERHLITYSLLGRGKLVKFKILRWQKHNRVLDYNAPCAKDTGFFFLPVSIANELLSQGRCSEMDALLDLWINTVYNDEQVQGSDAGRIYFQIALNYGSRDEIIRGIRKLAQDAADGKVKPEEIDEHVFDNYLDTAGIPDPDLMIRTSGELRLSNFLLWQMAYTEFYFTDVAWPDFNKAELIKAIEKYNQRDRRYGGVKEE